MSLARILSLALLPSLLSVAGTAQGQPAYLIVNNGLAPPNPANVWDEPFPDAAINYGFVSNQGCELTQPLSGYPIPLPCPNPGDPSSLLIDLPSGIPDLELQVRQTSSVILRQGGANYITAFEQSKVSIEGGGVSLMVDAYDSAQVEMSAGQIGFYLRGWNSSSITFSGGHVAEQLWVHDSASLLVTGGLVPNAYATGSSTVSMLGGHVSSWTFTGSSTASIEGGSLWQLSTGGTANVIVSGGSFTPSAPSFSISDESVLTLVGSGFAIRGLGALGEVAAQSGHLTGTLASGETIAFHFNRAPGATLLLVPEPSTALTLASGLAALALRRRRLS